MDWHLMIESIIKVIESLGIIIIVMGLTKALFIFVKTKFNYRDEELIVEIASALSLSLEFILAGEILHTLLVKDINQLLQLGILLILRIIITFVLHWELESIEKHKMRNEYSHFHSATYLEEKEKSDN